MSENEVIEQEEGRLEKVKEAFKKNWKPFTVGVVVTGVTIAVTRRFPLRYTSVDGTSVFIKKAVLRDNGFAYNVFNIYRPGFKNQGPSWMVKCKETGVLFRSQEHAAKTMGVSKGHMSKHLNGARPSVGGFHFERMGIAA